MRRLALATVVAAAFASCSAPHREPLQLDGNRLTVDNTSNTDWTGVEIWLNTYYRVTVRSIPAHGRFQTPLDSFVASAGQRFDFRRMQIRDLRLTAQAGGSPIEIQKAFSASALSDAIKGVGGKR